MIALGYVAAEKPKEIYDRLGEILAAADNGSVITKDHVVNILIRLCVFKKYSDDALALLMEQLLKAPVNQFPMYTERVCATFDVAQHICFDHVQHRMLHNT